LHHSWHDIYSIIFIYFSRLSIQILQDTEISVKSMNRPRVIFFGMPGRFSIPSLEALLASNIEVCAIVLPSSDRPENGKLSISRREPPRQARLLLPVRGSSLHANIMQIAWERNIPVFEVRRMANPLTISTLAAFAPDMICVACFSLYIPRVVLDIPRLGCLNVHPSLLPDNRGPEPLFWTFRRGDAQTGVTIHCMDEGMDSGDILAQEAIAVPDGIDYAALEAQSAQLGGLLLAKTAWQLYEGTAVAVPQHKTSRGVGLPRPHDLVLPRPHDSVLPRSHDPVLPRPHDLVLPRPHDSVLPRPHDPVLPRPHDLVLPRPHDSVLPRSHDPLSLFRAGQAHAPTDFSRKDADPHYLPFPSDQDFVIPAASWDARHVYNFIRGIASWNEPLRLQLDDTYIEVQSAVTFSLDTNKYPEEQSFRGDEGLWVRCKTGWVCVSTPTIFR
jgi:methionyl-tRNA formyltransferase